MKSIKDVEATINEIINTNTNTCCHAHIINTILSGVGTTFKGRKKIISFFRIAETVTGLKTESAHDQTIKPIIRRIQAIHEKYLSLTKAVERNSSELRNFLLVEFPLQHSSDTSLHQSTQSFALPPTHLQHQQTLPLPAPNQPHFQPSINLSLPNQQSQSTPVQSPAKTRRDCLNCSSTKKINVSLFKNFKSQKKEFKNISKNVKKELNIKAIKQKLLRKEKKLSEFKKSYRILSIKLKQQQLKCNKLISENGNLSKKLSYSEIKLRELEDIIKKKEEAMKYYDNLTASLEEEIKDLSVSVDNCDSFITATKAKAYSPIIRRLVYSQLVCDVPVKHCGHLLKEFAYLMCGRQLSDTPSPATCAQMAYELTSIQTISFMLSEDVSNICLSWDATSIDGCHINEVHVIVDRTQCFILDVRHLPGGKAVDYVEHIVSTLNEAVNVYCRCHYKAPTEVLAAISKKITCTLSDRAAVNGVVQRQLCSQFGSELLQLNCNIHPLDSVARQSKANLQKLDGRHSIQGNCYGKEGAAANLINAISVLRFKDGTGDPAGFKNMLRIHDLPVGTFVRYVGNRIHILFHLAGVVILHWDKLSSFLQNHCTAAGLLRSSLMKDMANEKIMAQVWALGVMGKTFSGPWMTKFYSGHMSNLEMRPLVQSTEKQLKTWLQMPQELLQATTNVFGEPLSPVNDDVLSSLNAFVCGEVEVQIDALSDIIKASLTVLQRQLCLFLDEEELSTEVKNNVSSAPTHNMAAERTLGSLDRMMRRAPIATGGFLNGKVLSKLNKCTQWLDRQNSDRRDMLINFAVSEARHARMRRGVVQKMTEKEINERRIRISGERNQKNKNKAVKCVKKIFKSKSLHEVECPDALKEKLRLFLESPEEFVGISFLHTVDQTEFYGRIQAMEQEYLAIGYWGLGDVESSSVDHNVTIIDFFADAILDLVVFL